MERRGSWPYGTVTKALVQVELSRPVPKVGTSEGEED